MEKKYIIYGLHKKLYILCTIFPLICISICYICIVAFKTLHKPYISERMFHLYFQLKSAWCASYNIPYRLKAAARPMQQSLLLQDKSLDHLGDRQVLRTARPGGEEVAVALAVG